MRLIDEERAFLAEQVRIAKACTPLGCNIYSLVERRADEQDFSIAPYQLDGYLEEIGEKPKELWIPPRTLCGGYRLWELHLKAHHILPEWHTRSDGAILYSSRWWGTTAPAEGWIVRAWFHVKSALEYELVSQWS